MNLYFLEDENIYVRNQAEAKGRGKSILVEVPSTSKDDMIMFLNELRASFTPTTQEFVEPIVCAPRITASEPTDVGSATVTLSRIDNPGINVDQIVETIGKSKGYALRRYAGAVAVAFQGLA